MTESKLYKYYRYLIIALLLVVFAYLFYVNELAARLAQAQQAQAAAIEQAVKPYQIALAKTQQQAALKKCQSTQ